MPKPYEAWTVTPHGPLEKVSATIWRVQAQFPGAPFPRTMQLVRLATGKLLIHNAIALDDAEMKEIEAWGEPGFLLVPSGAHRMDARIYKSRYPGLKVITAPGSRAKVDEVVKVDATEIDLGDPNVRYEPLAGVDAKEGVITVASDAGTTLIFNDVVMNIRSLPGFGGFMMGMMGFTSPGLKVTFPARMTVVKDKRALREDLEKRAAAPGLSRIEMAHGAAVTADASGSLRGAAAQL